MMMFALIPMILLLGVALIVAASMWTIFKKAGQPGWAAIVPIYNVIVLLEIVGKPWWWILLMCIPYVGIIWHIWSLNLLVQKFGKSAGFTVACIFFPYICLPILAWSDAKYNGDGPAPIPGVLDSGV